MAVTLFGVGAVAAAASGSVTPALPASFATNDVALCICAQSDIVVSTIAAGWNIVDATDNGAAHRCFWAWRRLTAGDAAPLITHAAGDAIIARIAVFSGVATSGDPYDVKSVNVNASSTTCTAAAITPGTAGSHIVFMGGLKDDGAWSGYSGTNPTFTEHIDNLTALGNDVSICLASGDKSDTTSTGNRTATNVRANINIGFMVALLPAGAGGAPPLPPLSLKVIQAIQRSAVH